MKADDSSSPNNALPPDNDEHDPALWALLDHARPRAAPSPYFTRRVLREIERQEEEKQVGSGWLPAWLTALVRPRAAVWTTAAVAGVAVVLTSVGLLRQQPHHRTAINHDRAAQSTAAAGETPLALTPADPEADGDVSVIVDLDDLLDAQQNRVWLDDDPAS